MKNKKTMIIVASILGVLLLVGVSYAWLTLTVTGTKTNVIKAGSLALTLDDTTSDGIFSFYNTSGNAYEYISFRIIKI